MTYSTGGPIQATDYNTFGTLANGMNQIFSDLYPGSTTLPQASFGYGQTPALSLVTVGAPVTATEWSLLFDSMRKSGTHQGTTVVPPLPSSNPAVATPVISYAAVDTLLTTLGTNRFNLAAGQSTLTTGNPIVQTAATVPWTNQLVFNYQVNFGSWDNARYFFNSGGKLQLNGSYSPIVSLEDAQWSAMLANMSPLAFNHNSTSPGNGIGNTAIGFYNLTTTPTMLYHQIYGQGAYYSGSYVEVWASLAGPAGTSGSINFSVAMVDQESHPHRPGTHNPKYRYTTYRIDTVKATGGSVAYPGSVTVAAIGPDNGFIRS